MAYALAFDVYGTLIDTQGILPKLRNMIGNKANEFSVLWRNKQLEYSFRRGLMQAYRDFSVCTENALDFACARLRTSLTQATKTSAVGRLSYSSRV